MRSFQLAERPISFLYLLLWGGVFHPPNFFSATEPRDSAGAMFDATGSDLDQLPAFIRGAMVVVFGPRLFDALSHDG